LPVPYRDADGLTYRQRRFAEEYPVDFNGTKAAIRAKYSERSAHAQATHLLKNPKVTAAIAKRVDVLTRAADVSTRKVIDSLYKLAFCDIRRAVAWDGDMVWVKPSDDLPDDVAFAVQEVRETRGGTSIKFHSRLQALDLLGKYLDLLVNKHPVTGPDGGPTQVEPTIPLEMLSTETKRRIIAELEGADSDSSVG